jgi:predicted ATPase
MIAYKTSFGLKNKESATVKIKPERLKGNNSSAKTSAIVKLYLAKSAFYYFFLNQLHDMDSTFYAS